MRVGVGGGRPVRIEEVMLGGAFGGSWAGNWSGKLVHVWDVGMVRRRREEDRWRRPEEERGKRRAQGRVCLVGAAWVQLDGSELDGRSGKADMVGRIEVAAKGGDRSELADRGWCGKRRGVGVSGKA